MANGLARYFTYLTKCTTPKACTILLRGPSKDVLNEIDRNLADAMSVARNVVFNPTLAPGGGATEMAISVRLQQRAKTVQGVESWPFKAVADAMEVIPRTLVQNAGGNAIRVLTELRVRPLSLSSPFVMLPARTTRTTTMKGVPIIFLRFRIDFTWRLSFGKRAKRG